MKLIGEDSCRPPWLHFPSACLAGVEQHAAVSWTTDFLTHCWLPYHFNTESKFHHFPSDQICFVQLFWFIEPFWICLLLCGSWLASHCMTEEVLPAFIFPLALASSFPPFSLLHHFFPTSILPLSGWITNPLAAPLLPKRKCPVQLFLWEKVLEKAFL